MAKRVQFRRGTSEQHNSFTGVLGEVTVDTTLKTIRVHDNVVVGGSIIATKDYVDGLDATTIKLTGNQTIDGDKTFTDNVVSNGQIVAGQGSGSVALTTNDGQGQANVTFNHTSGVPDSNGSSARIASTVDSTTASMAFEIYDDTTAGIIPINKVTPLILRASGAELSGTPTAPTAPVGTNNQQIATTAFVTNIDNINVKLTGDQTIGGIKTFSSHIKATTVGNDIEDAALVVLGDGLADTINPSIAFQQPGLFGGKIVLTAEGNFSFLGEGGGKGIVVANLNGSATTVNNGVYTIGSQTIGGVKTFSSSPVVPTPTAETQAVNKAYVDAKIALLNFTGLNQSLLANGYQKLPGGVIIQWGSFEPSASSTNVSFPTAFPSVCQIVMLNQLVTGDTGGVDSVPCLSQVPTRTSFVTSQPSSRDKVYWFAVGY